MEKVFILEEIDKYDYVSDILHTGKSTKECSDWLAHYLKEFPDLISGYFYKITECPMGGRPTASFTLYEDGLKNLIELAK